MTPQWVTKCWVAITHTRTSCPCKKLMTHLLLHFEPEVIRLDVDLNGTTLTCQWWTTFDINSRCTRLGDLLMLLLIINWITPQGGHHLWVIIYVLNDLTIPKPTVKALMRKIHQNVIKYLTYLVLYKRKLDNRQTPVLSPQNTHKHTKNPPCKTQNTKHKETQNTLNYIMNNHDEFMVNGLNIMPVHNTIIILLSFFFFFSFLLLGFMVTSGVCSKHK